MEKKDCCKERRWSIRWVTLIVPLVVIAVVVGAGVMAFSSWGKSLLREGLEVRISEPVPIQAPAVNTAEVDRLKGEINANSGLIDLLRKQLSESHRHQSRQ